MERLSKTPDEIKKGLETCSTKDAECENCPYYDEKCTYGITSDSFAYIQQLEAENAELVQKMQQLEKERDVLLHIAHDCGEICDECKHGTAINECLCMESDYFCHLCKADCKCNKCIRGSLFEWRGLCDENGGVV